MANRHDLPRPRLSGVPEYGARLGDAAFWGPYVAEALARHRLPAVTPRAGVVGTFPTFLAGEYVVKIFGELFYGAECHSGELSMLRLLRRHPEIPAPALIANGTLYRQPERQRPTAQGAEDWPWPYLIMTRLSGRTWREAALPPGAREQVARQLGAVIRRVHDLPPPAEPLWQRDWIAVLRANCVERHRTWATLPPHLIDQIAGYLAPPQPVRRLLHADIHEEHLFVADGPDGARLLGIIDWGDALYGDPYYELPALHLGTFFGDKRLLAAFLDGYGWEQGPDFVWRAMTMTLVFEFNVLRKTSEAINLDNVATLHELADLLWRLS
jgi:hypothetical protein